MLDGIDSTSSFDTMDYMNGRRRFVRERKVMYEIDV